MAAEPIDILLVEDTDDDVLLVRSALAAGKVANRLVVASTGDEALERLRGIGGPRFRPDLVLLDLNLPGMDGREVLAELKGDPDLFEIPVIVMTTSGEERDVKRVYELSANAYVQKPLDLDEFLTVVRGIEEFWLTIVRLPGRRGG